MKRFILPLLAAVTLSAGIAVAQDRVGSPGEWQPRLDTYEKDSEERLTIKRWDTAPAEAPTAEDEKPAKDGKGGIDRENLPVKPLPAPPHLPIEEPVTE